MKKEIFNKLYEVWADLSDEDFYEFLDKELKDKYFESLSKSFYYNFYIILTLNGLEVEEATVSSRSDIHDGIALNVAHMNGYNGNLFLDIIDITDLTEIEEKAINKYLDDYELALSYEEEELKSMSLFDKLSESSEGIDTIYEKLFPKEFENKKEQLSELLWDYEKERINDKISNTLVDKSQCKYDLY